MIEIIHNTTGGAAKAPRLDADARRTVRSHAMRHFRRRQKDARSSGKKTPSFELPRRGSDSIIVLDEERRRLLLPAPGRTTATNDNRTLTDRERRDECADYEGSRLDASDLVPTSRTSLDNSGCHGNIQISHPPDGAGFYRYVLAEMFGDSLIGSSLKRPRSAGILSYRGYVAGTRSGLLHATDDTVCLLLPGCSMLDPRILLEARRRYVVGLRCMQIALEDGTENIHGTEDVLSTIAGALELLFIEIFKPMSLGLGSLYGGLVHLVCTRWQELTSSQAPVTRFLLAQLRQVMLMESLTSRTTLPIPFETWESAPHASGLIPETTETLMPMATQVPALLDNVRKMQQTDFVDPLIQDHALSDILALERSLIHWQTRYCMESLDAVAVPYLSQSPDHSSPHSMEKFRNLPLSTTQCSTLCFICLLLLQESVANLSAACGNSTLKIIYITHATRTANALCRVADYFIQYEDGLLSKALSVCVPLHLARQWYETNNDLERAAAAKEKELRVQNLVPFLSWRSLLPLSLNAMYMHA